MKKVFLVRKDVNRPYGEDNWQIMNAAEFKQFKASGDATGRRFQRLFPYYDGCDLLVKECEQDEAREISRVVQRVYRARRYAKQHDIKENRYSLVRIDDEWKNSEELIPDERQNVEKIVLNTLMIEELKNALTHLTEDEQKLIKICFFSEKKSLRQIARESGVPYGTLQYRKSVILNKLRKLL